MSIYHAQMMSSPVRQRRVRRVAGLALVSATASALTAVGPAGSAAAEDPPPPAPAMHSVKYTVFAEQPTKVDIYYRDLDPPTWADYSHNPYVYSPKVEVHVGPDEQWNLDVWLKNPDEWAMVTATSGPGQATPNIHCVLAVDGVVVKTHQGPKGALCSIRHW
ncbi:hypothetical protein MHAS44199_16570 [Mycolicibacterium hassiacum DSM 44199]|nr:hypothetical protein [Mycolicibacterium hassiacum DSM 44199]